MNINPAYYNLTSKVVLLELGPNHIGIQKLLKSRIIQKDAIKIVEIALLLKEKQADLKVSLVCYDNICSKSLKLLAENGILIVIHS